MKFPRKEKTKKQAARKQQFKNKKMPQSTRSYISKSHQRSPEQEAKRALVLGGRTTKGSGNGYEKGDVVVDNLLRVECKTTMKKSFSVTREMMSKINNATTQQEVGCMQIDFTDNNGRLDYECYVIPAKSFEVIVDKLHSLQDELND